MRHYSTLLTLLLLVGTPAACLAARLEIDAAPTVDLPGYTTYKLSIAVEGTETLRGIDADFRGPMNQMYPAGMASVFHLGIDTRPFLPFILTADSHFWFEETSVLSFNTSESSDNLTAAFSILDRAPRSNPTLFAQIVTNDPAAVSYELNFDLLATSSNFRGSLAIPEPSSLVLVSVVMAAASIPRRQHRPSAL